MPCIQLTTNRPISSEKQERLKSQFGKAIELLPRKSEKWLMCIFRPECDMYFQGQRGDLAFLEVDVFGQLDHEPCEALTKELMQIVHAEMDIEQDKIYVKYSVTPNWGWNGKNF